MHQKGVYNNGRVSRSHQAINTTANNEHWKLTTKLSPNVKFSGRGRSRGELKISQFIVSFIRFIVWTTIY